MFRKETVLIIDYQRLPSDIKTIVRKRYSDINGDRFIKYDSNMSPVGNDPRYSTWGARITQENINEYWQDQVKKNSYTGDLDQFIKDYYIEFDRWLLDQDVDLTGIKTILIN